MSLKMNLLRSTQIIRKFWKFGLYHPLDERTGVLISPNGEPYTGERNTFSVDTDSVILKETVLDGKVVQTVHNLHDTTGTPYKWVTILL